MARTTIRTEDITASEVTTAKMAVDPTNADNLSSGSVAAGRLTAVPGANITGTIPSAALSNVDLSPLEADIAVLGFELASTQSLAKYNLAEQTIDSFVDQTGVDTSASSNEIYNSTDKYYSTVGVGATALLTQPITGSPGNASGWDINFSTYSSSCLDSSATGSNCLLSDGIGPGHYVGVDFGSGNERRISKIGFYSLGGVYLLFGEVHYSSDNSNWTTITPSTGAGGSPTATGVMNYTSLFNNTAAGVKARYWRAVKTNAANNGAWSSTFEWYETPDLVNATGSLISNSTTAASTPTKGDIVLSYTDQAGTAVLNTDIKCSVSRDNGTTYTQGTLVSKGNAGTHKIASFHDLDISGQPAGTSMRYKFEWANQAEAKETRLQAISLGWS